MREIDSITSLGGSYDQEEGPEPFPSSPDAPDSHGSGTTAPPSRKIKIKNKKIKYTD